MRRFTLYLNQECTNGDYWILAEDRNGKRPNCMSPNSEGHSIKFNLLVFIIILYFQLFLQDAAPPFRYELVFRCSIFLLSLLFWHRNQASCLPRYTEKHKTKERKEREATCLPRYTEKKKTKERKERESTCPPTCFLFSKSSIEGAKKSELE